MRNHTGLRLELIPLQQIKRMRGLKIDATPKRIEKMRKFAVKRGYCMPVVLSESQGCLTLLSGAATFEACLEEKGAKVPAVIVQTEGEADNLMFALQSAALGEAPDAIAVSAVLVRLIDEYGVSRKDIAEMLEKSPAWVNRMENISRKLNDTVQLLITEGHISSRSAQEIARLPKDVQTPFAISAGNEFLSKDNIACLVNRYLDEDTGDEERDRIINNPRQALPDRCSSRARKGKDRSDSARLSRAIAICLDNAAYLSRLLDHIDRNGIAVYIPDVIALVNSLSDLSLLLQTVFLPGGKNDLEGIYQNI